MYQKEVSECRNVTVQKSEEQLFSLLIASTQTNESNPAAKGCRKSS